MRLVSVFPILGPLVLGLIGGCQDFDTTRTAPPRGTVGEEVYGVFCDRLAGQLLREDLSGASFRGVCHKDGGQFAEDVDESKLPAISGDLPRKDGTGTVSVAEQQAGRARAVARIKALVSRRAEVIEALETLFPEADVQVLDIKNRDPKQTCKPAEGNAAIRSFGLELADMLSRFTDLYNDDTLPGATRSIAHVLDYFKGSPEAQSALARINGREGYRPLPIDIGMARPIVAYPRFRDLAAETLRLVAYDSEPYAADPPRNPDGSRKRVPGAAYGAWSKLLEVAHHEMRTSTVDARTPLVIERDAAINVDRLSRPRENLEFTSELFFVQDARFGSGAPNYIAKRDRRGYAALARPIEAPFVDKDKDKLPDVDVLGRFLTVDGNAAPTPFATVTQQGVKRDEFGRAVIVDQQVFGTVDTSHNFGAALLNDLRPLLDPAKDHILSMTGGAYAVMGKRVKAQKAYANAAPVEYQGFDTTTAPIADFMYALGQILGDRSTDDFLQYTRLLFAEHEKEVASVAGEMLAFQEIAKKHDEAKLKASSVFWDEILDVIAEIAKDRSLVEDLLGALTDPATLNVGNVFGNLMQWNDRISYDRANINGEPMNQTTGKAAPPSNKVDRSKPDTGWNRSQLQRLVHIVNDADGVAMCNKDGAIVHGKGIPLAGSLDLPLFGATYKECEVFKIDNLAHFYLSSIVGKAQLYFRPSILRNGVAGIGAATVDTIQQSSGLQGFWDAPESKTFRPKPEWLNRLVYFDQVKDTNNSTTNLFTRDLNGPHLGTIHCPERTINDPVPDAPDAASDGIVRGLRSCRQGDWLDERHPDALFVLEHFDAYDALAPLVRPFADRGRQDLIVKLFKALHRHYQSEAGAPPECDSSNPKNAAYCSKSGISSYEPLLVEAFPRGIFKALHELAIVLNNVAIPRCTKLGADKKCQTTQAVSGLTVLADATEALMSPDRAKEVALKDRLGNPKAKRNDGTENPQVTPIYLMLQALNAVDAAFAESAKTPGDEDRQARWRAARSALVDQFLSVNGTGSQARFANPIMAKVTPTLIDLIRAQLLARCPDSFVPPYKRCAWMRDEIPQKTSDTIRGPLMASTMDLLEIIRKDQRASDELELLLVYLTDPASRNEALTSLRAAATDAMQSLQNDEDLVPIYHIMAEALGPSIRDEAGNVTQAGLVDAHTSLVSRLAARARDADGQPVCSREIDPNQILTIVLKNAVTPIRGQNGTQKRTPFDVLVDVIGDVNRADPTKTGRLEPNDFGPVANDVSDFLSNRERGLEQFYTIIKNGTR